MSDTTVTVTAGMPTTVTVTGGVADVSIDVQRGIPGPNSITTSTLSNLTGFISANGTTVSGATAGATDATPSTLVLRNANGGVVFTSTTDSAALLATGSNATAGNFQSSTATAVNIFSTSGTGASITSTSGTGASIGSGTGTAATIESGTGNHLNIGSGKLIVANNGATTLTGTIAASNLSGTNTGDQFTAVTSQRLIGRHAGSSGAAQEVTVGDGLEFSGSGIRRSALTGDVTATAGSNATTLASTIAGAKTLSGQLELTGQAATNSTSAMTRSLVDSRSLVSLQGTSQIINNVATYTASNMTLSLGVGTWELNGLFYINAAATGGSKIYISVVSGTQPESYTHRFTFLRVAGGSSTPTLGSDAPAYGAGTFPFRLERTLTNSGDSIYNLNPSLLVLTTASQIDIGFSQNTAAVGNLTLYNFSKFWAKRLTH